MAKMTIVYAVLLVVLGVGMYGIAAGGLIEGTKGSTTALIPAFLAVPFFILGGVAMASDGMRKHLMHAAVAVALLLVLMGLGMSLWGLVKAGFDVGELSRPLATLATGLMGLISLAYVGMGVRSFIAAKKARKLAGV